MIPSKEHCYTARKGKPCGCSCCNIFMNVVLFGIGVRSDSIAIMIAVCA
ncbi:unnamed protein product [Amoebophrya sp. A25]|nr:unnamed protein product [Amoebophrya sp. A25]|eukprot:GSA25T00021508001.1